MNEPGTIRLDRIGETIGPVVHEYGARDVILYHLGIGAGADDLRYVYEEAPGGFLVCPTYAVIPSFGLFINVLRLLEVPLASILHGEESIVLCGAIPPRGRLFTRGRASAAYDKRKAALLIVETETADGAGTVLFRTSASLVCRGLGGFGGDPGPRGTIRAIPEGRPPDFEISAKTGENQAALYRLSGDANPLHIDPAAAAAAGFPRPILHGLCTFGFAGRAVLAAACGNNAGRFKEFGCRFRAPVFPGETIVTAGWDMGGGLYHVRVFTDSGVVLSNAYARVEGG